MYDFFNLGSSIFELLPLTFYDIKKENVTGIHSWMSLLKKHNLMSFMENTHLAKLSKPKEDIKWYYLGRVDWNETSKCYYSLKSIRVIFTMIGYELSRILSLDQSVYKSYQGLFNLHNTPKHLKCHSFCILNIDQHWVE